jgi:hypothetical protein
MEERPFMLPAIMSRITRSLSLAALLASACSSTSFVSSWRPPTARPINLKGAKVAAVVLVNNPGSRRTAEDTLAREISSRGALGVPLYRILPNAKEGDEAEVRAALEKEQFKGVVVMRPIGSKQKISVTAQPGYNNYWGGYYRYGWGTSYEYREDTIVSVDIRVYSLEQNQLVWAGESKTTNPERVDEFVIELAEATADELRNRGLIE